MDEWSTNSSVLSFGFLICFLCLCGYVCVFARLCIGVYVSACRPGNEALCMDVLVCYECVSVCVLGCTLCMYVRGCMRTFVCVRMSVHYVCVCVYSFLCVLQCLAQLYSLLVILV